MNRLALEDESFKTKVQDVIKEDQSSPECQGDSDEAKMSKTSKTIGAVVPLAQAQVGEKWGELNIPNFDANNPQAYQMMLMQVSMMAMMDPVLKPSIEKIMGQVTGTAVAA